MEFQKISKEEYFKLSKEEQDYLTLKFNQSVEARKRLTLIITRILALIFIGVLFYIGYVQLESVKNYNEKIDKYGTMGFCALCGEYNLKKCECQYAIESQANIQKFDINLTKISLELTDYNKQECKPYAYYVNDNFNELINFSFNESK